MSARQQRNCPAPGCTIMVPFKQVMCGDHWFSVPPEIRSRIWTNFRRRSDDPRHEQALADARAYLEAQATVA